MKPGCFVYCLAGALLATAPMLSASQETANPEYQAWAKFKVGASLSLKKKIKEGLHYTEVEQTLELAEVTKEKVVLDMPLMQDRSTGFGAVGVHAESGPREIPAKIKKADPPKGETKSGDEEIKIGEKTVKCRWVEIRSEEKGVRTWSKTWTCPDIPGGIAKIDSKDAQGTTEEMWVTAWEKE
jgi:hypothetical protein